MKLDGSLTMSRASIAASANTLPLSNDSWSDDSLPASDSTTDSSRRPFSSSSCLLMCLLKVYSPSRLPSAMACADTSTSIPPMPAP